MSVKTELINDDLYITFENGELHFENVDSIKKELQQRIDVFEYKDIYINLKNIYHIDSSGISLFIMIKRLQIQYNKDAQTYLMNINPAAKKVFHLLGISSMFVYKEN